MKIRNLQWCLLLVGGLLFLLQIPETKCINRHPRRRPPPRRLRSRPPPPPGRHRHKDSLSQAREILQQQNRHKDSDDDRGDGDRGRGGRDRDRDRRRERGSSSSSDGGGRGSHRKSEGVDSPPQGQRRPPLPQHVPTSLDPLNIAVQSIKTLLAPEILMFKSLSAGADSIYRPPSLKQAAAAKAAAEAAVAEGRPLPPPPPRRPPPSKPKAGRRPPPPPRRKPRPPPPPSRSKHRRRPHRGTPKPPPFKKSPKKPSSSSSSRPPSTLDALNDDADTAFDLPTFQDFAGLKGSAFRESIKSLEEMADREPYQPYHEYHESSFELGPSVHPSDTVFANEPRENEIAEGFGDDDAFSSPPFASGFGREDEDGPSGPPPFGTDEPPPPPPPSFKSKLPTSGFRDSQQPRVRRPRRPRPSYPTVGGGSGSGGGGDDLDDYLCHPPLCHPPPPPPIPPSTAAAALPSSSHFPLPPASTPLLHDEHNSIISTTSLQPSEPSSVPLLDGDGPSTETWQPLRPNPSYPGFTAPLASFFREEHDGGGSGDFPGPLPPLDREEGEEGGGGGFKKLQAETIKNAQQPSLSSEAPNLPFKRSNPTGRPSTLSFSPQSAPTPRPTPSPVYYKPLPPQQSHFDKTLGDHVVRSQFGGPLRPPPPPEEEERYPEETFEPRQEDIDLDGGNVEFEGDDGSDSRVPVGFSNHKGFKSFKIPDFFRNFLSAPPVWIKDKL